MSSRKRFNDGEESGKGGELAKVDTRYYDELFVKIQESDEFKDEESFDILCNNIVDQIAEDEKELKKCLYSIHIDYFIYKLSPDHFTRLLDSMTGGGEGDDADTKLGAYLNDAKMSRAYDACLLLCAHKITKSTTEKIQAFVGRLCEYFLSQIETMLDAQPPATGLFVLRSLVRVLGKSDLLDDHVNKGNQGGRRGRNEFGVKDIELKLLPADWTSCCKFIKKLAKKIKAINVLEKALVANISPLISLVLRKMHFTFPDDSSDLFDSIHKQFVKKPNSFHSMIQDAVGSRFIESYLLCLQVDLLVDHYLENHIMTNLISYVNHIYANYPLQTLLRHRVPVESRLSSLFDSLVESLQSIINLHTDLSYKNYFIVELIAACQKSDSLDRAKLINTLVEYFGCDTDDNRLHFLKALLVYEKVEDINKECGLDQALFMFEIRPIATTIASKLIELDDKTITKSFSALNSNDLEHLCTNNSGSHFIQHCLRTFHAKDRTVWLQGFMDKLKGRYAILCSNKSGSFVVETIWSVSNLKQRIAIADELKSTENQLRNDRFGRFFVNKIGLSFYKRKPEEWKQIQTNEFKKKKMLEELLEDDSSASVNQNKKKKMK